MAAIGAGRVLFRGLHLGYCAQHCPRAQQRFPGEQGQPRAAAGQGLGCTMDERRLGQLGWFSLEKRGPRWEGSCVAAAFYYFKGMAEKMEPDHPHECMGRRTGCRLLTVASVRFWGCAGILYPTPPIMRWV